MGYFVYIHSCKYLIKCQLCNAWNHAELLLTSVLSTPNIRLKEMVALATGCWCYIYNDLSIRETADLQRYSHTHVSIFHSAKEQEFDVVVGAGTPKPARPRQEKTWQCFFNLLFFQAFQWWAWSHDSLRLLYLADKNATWCDFQFWKYFSTATPWAKQKKRTLYFIPVFA